MLEVQTRIEMKRKAFEWGAHALTQREVNPKSKLWRMRVRQALRRLEELYGGDDALLRRVQIKEGMAQANDVSLSPYILRPMRSMPKG